MKDQLEKVNDTVDLGPLVNILLRIHYEQY